jgi:hypothetical protein
MSTNGPYHTWFQGIAQLPPNQRKMRDRNLVWLIVRVLANRLVRLTCKTVNAPGEADQNSTARRLRRCLDFLDGIYRFLYTHHQRACI